MAYKDLQAFMAALEKLGLLKRITVPVSTDLEITEIADRVMKDGGPALLFERVKDSPYPLLINTFGSFKRAALALEVERIDDVAGRITSLFDLSSYASLFDKVKAIPKLAPYAFIFPHTVKRAPCQEVIETEPDLDSLPILRCWPGDGGRFLTLPQVITRDPETGQQNMGMYRMQVFDKRTTGMHWHLHKDGRETYELYRRRGGRMPVSVALGSDPATIYAATAPLPRMIDEMIFAGFLRKESVPVVKCKTNDLLVPAHAEFILEGYVDVDEPLRTEGPFGDHTGYYSLTDEYPVFHLTCITRKRRPVYPATIVGRPPMEDCFLGKMTERIFLPLLKLQIPEIVDFDFPLEGVFHNCVIVSIKKMFPGHAKKVMNAIWGSGQMMYTKMIVVVDETVNPHDYSEVAWRVFNNIDAGRDLVVSPGPLDALDHASPLSHLGNRLGIDATKKWPAEGHPRPWPDDITMSREIKELVSRRWKEYGF